MKDICDPFQRWVGSHDRRSDGPSGPLFPIANPDALTVPQGVEQVSVRVLDNDINLGQGGLTLLSAVATYGYAIAEPDGTVTYSPPDIFVPNDTIMYQVENAESLRSTSYVTVTLVADALMEIRSIGPQDDDSIPVAYTISEDMSFKIVLYPANHAAPKAADFGGVTQTFVDLGEVSLTVSGVDIALDLPDGLQGIFRIAVLPIGGTDADVMQSPEVFLDTQLPTLLPEFVRAPVFGAPSYTIGDTVTFDLGLSSNDGIITLTAFTLDGLDQMSSVDAGTWSTLGQSAGTINATFTATNASGHNVHTLSVPLVAASQENAAFEIVSIGLQNNKSIAVSYTISADTTFDVLIYLSGETAPKAADFGRASLQPYTDLGQIALTIIGADISLDLPSGLNGIYHIALLPVGSGDEAVTLSDPASVDTRISVPSDITATYLSTGTNGVYDRQTTHSFSIDMADHNGVDDVVLVFAVFMRLSSQVVSIVLDGHESTQIYNQTIVGNDRFALGYAVFAGRDFADLSDITVVSGNQMWRVDAVAYAIPTGADVSTLTDQVGTIRTGSVLGGITGSGSAIIAAQGQRNGENVTPASWGDLNQDYQTDISNGEWLNVASASAIVETDVIVSPDGGSDNETTGLSIEVAAS